MNKVYVGGATCLLALLGSAAAPAACDIPVKTPFHFLALFKNEYLGRMENENQLGKICPPQGNGKSAEDYKTCVAAALKPENDVMKIYDRPNGADIGSLVVTYAPGKELSAKVVVAGKEVAYVPTVFDADWGYGPWFHATLLDRSNDWLRIALPAVKSGWIRMAKPVVLRLKANERYALSGGVDDVTVTAVDAKSVTVRDESPPSGKPATHTYKINELYSDDCEALIKPSTLRD